MRVDDEIKPQEFSQQEVERAQMLETNSSRENPGSSTCVRWDCGLVAPPFWAPDAISAKWKASYTYSFTNHSLSTYYVLGTGVTAVPRDWPAPASGAEFISNRK